MENLQATITSPVLPPVESDQASSVQSGPSPVAEWAVNLSNAAISDPDLAMRLSSLQREEGEVRPIYRICIVLFGSISFNTLFFFRDLKVLNPSHHVAFLYQLKKEGMNLSP